MKSFIVSSLLSFTTLIVLGIVVLVPINIAQAVDIKGEFKSALGEAGLIKDKEAEIVTPEVAVGKIINTILTYIGVLTLVMIIYAGGLWATARGNEKAIEKSKKILVGGIIGLAIIFSAAAMVNFVISKLGTALQ